MLLLETCCEFGNSIASEKPQAPIAARPIGETFLGGSTLTQFTGFFLAILFVFLLVRLNWLFIQ